MTDHSGSGMPLSVVMTSRGDPALLRITVPAVLRAAFQPSRDEIIVVIDGPLPAGDRLLEELVSLSSAVRVFTLPESCGAGLARLFGVTRARNEVVVLVDGDVALKPFALQEHRRFHQHGSTHPSLLVGAMPVVEPDRQGIDDLPAQVQAQAYRDAVQGWQAAPHTIAENLLMGHLSVRKADVLAAETVRPTRRIDHLEGADLGLRLSLVGVRMSYSDRAAAQHLYRSDLRTLLQGAAERGRSAVTLSRRWPTVPVGPTAPSGQSVVRTVTSSLFRQTWFVRAVEGWLRKGSGRVSDRRRRRVLLVRDLVEQAWFDHGVRQGEADRALRTTPATAIQEPGVTRRFANTGRRA